VTADGGILPGVSGILDDRRQFDEGAFPTWVSLIEHWRDQISAVAREIKQGHAAVIFDTENDLDLYFCDVKPLLRLPEYRAQRAKVAAEGTP
jgi:exodeoxyribonuclease-5